MDPSLAQGISLAPRLLARGSFLGKARIWATCEGLLMLNPFPHSQSLERGAIPANALRCHPALAPFDSLDSGQGSCFSQQPQEARELGTGPAQAPSLARVCSSTLPGPRRGQIMVWKESSWAAHYQSPLPASDTLFTEAPGPDSPERRQQTQGTALPSPHPLALALLDFANSWAHTGLYCRVGQREWTLLEGHPPSHPSMPSTC